MLDFQARCDKLFGLIFCKCKIIFCKKAGCEGCYHSAHITCICKREKTIPLVELDDVRDQRNIRSSKSISSIKNVKDGENKTDYTPPLLLPAVLADIGEIQPVGEVDVVQESFDDNDPNARGF